MQIPVTIIGLDPHRYGNRRRIADDDPGPPVAVIARIVRQAERALEMGVVQERIARIVFPVEGAVGKVTDQGIPAGYLKDRMIQRIPCTLSELILDLQDPLFTGRQHDIEIPCPVRAGPREMEPDGILLYHSG